MRVRPFNKREIELAATGGNELCIEMNGNQTTIKNLHPKQNEKSSHSFSFDYSYWSHDGFIDENGVMSGITSKYADQEQVFNQLGREVLDNAFEGYNTCLFAYGQTGSGKSYSMIGYGKNLGIVPKVCEEIFSRIKESDDGEKRFEVSVSMLEIYNECVQDLLVHPKFRKEKSLKVSEDPKKGVYVMGLTSYLVTSYKEIARKLDEGSNNRTVGETNMNQTSSRAHTVFRINFKQIFKINGEETYKTSDINLVDLAGSERAGSTGATGDRLKEGCNINQSLSTLGKVISALADKAAGKLPKSAIIPYRDSKLTRILQSALGGNSKTTMIAALSPSFANYDETLSTLRYADRVKQIKNAAIVNEDPAAAELRRLQEENAKLLALLSSRGGDASLALQPSTSEFEMMRKEYEAKVAELENMALSYEERLKRSRESDRRNHGGESLEDYDDEDDNGDMEKNVDKLLPDLRNLSDDPQLSGRVRFKLKPGINSLGRASNNKDDESGNNDESNSPDISVVASGLLAQHAIIELMKVDADGELNTLSEDDIADFKNSLENNEDKILLFGTKITALGKVFINGELLSSNESRQLFHKDIISFGSLKFLIFWDPRQQGNDPPTYPDWDEVTDLVQSAQPFEGAVLANEVKLSAEAEKKLQEEQQRIESEKKAMEERQADFEREIMRREAAVASKDRAEAAKIREELRHERESQKRQLEAQQRSLELKARQLEKERGIQQIKQEKEARARRLLESTLSKALLLVEEANNVATDIGKAVLFSCQLVTKSTNNLQNNSNNNGSGKAAPSASSSYDDGNGDVNLEPGPFERSEIVIKVEMLDNEYSNIGSVHFWSLDVFEDRLYTMRDLWNQWASGDASTAEPSSEDEDEFATKDPFAPDPEARMTLGSCWLYLDSLRNLISVPKEIIPILDHRGSKVGNLTVGLFLQLLDARSEEDAEEEMLMLDSIEDLEGRRIRFTLVIAGVIELEKTDYCAQLNVKTVWVDGVSEVVATPLSDVDAIEFRTNARTGQRFANVQLNCARDFNVTLTPELIKQIQQSDLCFEVSAKSSSSNGHLTSNSASVSPSPTTPYPSGRFSTLGYNKVGGSVSAEKMDQVEDGEEAKLKAQLEEKDELLKLLAAKLGGEEALKALLGNK